MRNISLLIPFFLLFSGTTWGQRPSDIVKNILKGYETRLSLGEISSVELMKFKRLLHLEKSHFRMMEQDLSPYFIPKEKTLPLKIRKENTKLQEELVRRWLELDFYVSQRKKFLQQSIRADIVRGPIDYSLFIPSDLRLLMLGEVHGQPWILEEVKSVVKYIHQTYPNRHIYYAAEFVYAHPTTKIRPLQEQGIRRFSVNEEIYQELLRSFLAYGVKVIGLENPAILTYQQEAALEEKYFLESRFAWRVLSPLGMKERNAYWARRIEAIYQQDPEALVIVHAGINHVSYDQLNSMPFQLKKWKPFVIEFSFPQDSNLLLEKSAMREEKKSILQKTRDNDSLEEPIFCVYQVQSKKAAVAAGSDVSVRILNREVFPF